MIMNEYKENKLFIFLYAMAELWAC